MPTSGYRRTSAWVIGVATVEGLAAANSAQAADAVLEEIVVSGSRLPASLQSMPQSAQIVGAQQLQEQLSATPDLAEALANIIPGLGHSSFSSTNITSTLRGRKPVFLVDGVPVTSTLNDTGREMYLVDPSNIDHIEVVPGSSALYGNSAGAGFINYVTRHGDPEAVNFRSALSTNVGLTGNTSDGLAPTIDQTVSGTLDAFDYRVTGEYQRLKDFFDADGNRIPPAAGIGLQHSTIKSGFGKLGYNFGDRERVEGLLSYYEQKAAFKWSLQNGDIAKGIPAVAIPATPAPGQVPEEESSLVGSLSYATPAVFDSASSLHTQLYYLKTEGTFEYVSNRFPLLANKNGQSQNFTEKYGARIDFITPLKSILPIAGSLLWGFDYLHDDTKTPLVDGRTFGIPLALESEAAFLQLQLTPIEDLSVSAGARLERSRLHVADYDSLFTLAHITGTDLTYTSVPLNAGAVYSLGKSVDLFAGFSQGFDIQQFSQAFRSWPVNIDLGAVHPPVNLVNSYEVGVRLHGHDFSGSVSGYLVKSSNGISYVFNPLLPAEGTARMTPDKVQGIEATLDYRGFKGWELGLTYATLSGHSDTDNDGSYETPLSTRRIPPATLAGHVNWQISERLQALLNVQYSDSRNPFPNTTPGRFGEGRVHAYFLANASVNCSLDRYGTLTAGINNLLNRDYFTNYAESANIPRLYVKAPGRSMSLRYEIRY